MAHVSLIPLDALSFVGDNDAQLVAGDVAAIHGVPGKGRPVLIFDDTAENAALTPELIMPGQYAGGTLVATVTFFMASDNTGDIALDVYVEAVTPGTDTLDMNSATSWDTANSATVSVSGSTAGDPLTLAITLTNKDSVAASDVFRIGIRRDTDSGDDDAVGDLYITNIDVWEST